jgi:hypothetical protein
VTDCILRNVDQGRIFATNVVRWDTSVETATRPKWMVLVHLEGNNCRTRVKHNYQSCLRHVGSPYFVVKGWITGCFLRHQQVVFCFVLALDLGFWT